jgi:hypothetical protein
VSSSRAVVRPNKTTRPPERYCGADTAQTLSRGYTRNRKENRRKLRSNTERRGRVILTAVQSLAAYTTLKGTV